MTEAATGQPGRWTRPLGAALVLLAVAHAVAVGRHYHVGSFDDDANYILVARALAHGYGLTSTLPAGLPLVAAYPPGYGALLSPIAAISGSAYLAFRAVSLALLVVVLALTWAYLGRRRIGTPLRLAVLGLLALNPVLATFATMVMPEMAFAVVFLVLLLASERWEPERGLVTLAGVATVVSGAGLLWLKQAGVGLVVGVVVWLLFRRAWRKAVALGGATAVLFAPVLIARAIVGGSLIGSRYSDEFGNVLAGGLAHQFTSVIPHAISTYASEAIPQSIVPTSVSPLPVVGPVAGALGTFGSMTAPLVVIGFVVWAVRHRDAVSFAVPVYVAETLLYPFVNERRLILILPVLVAWYALGWWTVIAAVSRRLPRAYPAVPVLAVVAAILVPQFGRDYLFALGQDSPTPIGSSYMGLLSRLGSPRDVVETDFVWTTNLASGHRTANDAYLDATNICYGPALAQDLRNDGASYFLSAAMSSLPGVGSPCLLQFVASSPGAVRLYRTARDDASVFELLDPGAADLTRGVAPSPAAGVVTSHPETPQAPDDPGGTYLTIPTVDGAASVTWSWKTPAKVAQVTVGAAGAVGDAGPAAGSSTTESVDVELQGTNGAWRRVARVRGAVGDGSPSPYLLARPGVPGVAVALRVTVHGTGSVALHDVHAIGAAPPSAGASTQG